MTTEAQPNLRDNIEEPIDPALPICDPHHHFWKSGVQPPGDPHYNRYMLEELQDDTGSGHNIVSTVYVECRSGYRTTGRKILRPVGETEFVRKLVTAGGKAKTAVAAGIVGAADLTLGVGVDLVLEKHIAAGEGVFRGIRMSAVWDPHPEIPAYTSPPKGLLLDARFREGFARLKKYNLVFDAWLYFHQMRELADLAKTFPNIPIVLNHVGGPILVGPYAVKQDEVWAEWRKGITALAACPNVVIKLGGLGMTRCGFGWDTRKTPIGSVELAAETAPYYLFCIDRFGTKRSMFESNFPVDKVSYSYSVLWNSFKRIAAGFSAAERADLFHDTATRVYRLKA